MTDSGAEQRTSRDAEDAGSDSNHDVSGSAQA